MPKVQLENGRILEFEQNPTPEDIDFVISKQSDNKVELIDAIGNTEVVSPGEIMSKETFNAQQAPFAQRGAGQFIGGLAGGVAGGLVGHPVLGSATGGVVGRGLVNLGQVEATQPKRILPTAKIPLSTGNIPMAALSVGETLLRARPEQRKMLSGDIGKTAVAEGISMPLGVGLNKIGQGIIKNLLPKEVAQRGLTKGFAPMLKKEYYGENLPQNFKQKVADFFKINKNKYGEVVSKTINQKKYKDMTVDMRGLQQQIEQIFPNNITVDDIDASPAQKKMIKGLVEKVMVIGRQDMPVTQKQMLKLLKQQNKTIPQLWELRKELDDIIYNHKWSIEAEDYLKKFRNILNNPIRGAGKDIAESFDKFNFVQQAKGELAGKMSEAVKDRSTGQVYSKDIDIFVKQLMNPNNREYRALIEKIDPEFADELFDVASAQVLQKSDIPINIPGSPRDLFMTGINKVLPFKGVARLGALGQKPAVKFIKSASGRLIPITARESEQY